MTNKIRNFMKDEVTALLPTLHAAYCAIGRFQKKRDARNEARLLEHLEAAGAALQQFKPLVQHRKQCYFDAVLSEGLSTSDRIIALDTAVGAMHIEFAVPRMYMHQESEELRRVLDACRIVKPEQVAQAPRPADGAAEILCRGIPASPGIAMGSVVFAETEQDYRSVPDGCILVARTATTDIIFGIERISGIVTDCGGRLCHAAIVARERSIPCVVGARDATRILRNGIAVWVDGTEGVVTLAR